MIESGLRVVISAGAGGIGRRMAERFSEAGARVWVCDIDANAINSLADTDITGRKTDVRDEDAVRQFMTDALDDLGGLDVLINNAGTAGPTALIEDIDYADWQTCISCNLDGAFLFSRAAAPVMKQQGYGSIINMSSTAGLFGYPFRAPYSASKWAVIGLTKTLACELGPHGIRVNAICPGSVDGPRMDLVIAREAAARGRTEAAQRQEYENTTSMRAFVSADDIADTALFLSSPAAARISGQALSVDGHTERLT